MLVWPLPDERRARARLMVHESFHRVQERIGLGGGDPPNRHLDSRHGRTWLRLEWRALERALEESGAARRQAVADALLFRRWRQQRFPRAAAEEAALELREGLAEYTGYRLSTRSPGELTAEVACRLRDDGRKDSFARSFAYASGPAYGALLDALRPGWRAALRPGADLAELLRGALRIDRSDTAGAAQMRAAAYDGDEVDASEERREAARARQLAEQRARFVSGPVLRLPLAAPRYSFDPNQVQPLDQLGAVHPTLRVVDRWGVLEASRGALMVQSGDRPVEVRVPAPRSMRAPLRGDGWTLVLAAGWTIAPGPRRGDLTVRPPRPR